MYWARLSTFDTIQSTIGLVETMLLSAARYFNLILIPSTIGLV